MGNEHAQIEQRPLSKSPPAVFNLKVVQVAFHILDKQIVADMPKKRQSLLYLHPPSLDNEVGLAGQDACQQRDGRFAAGKDGVHEKVTKQRELLNHKVVLMIVQISTSKKLFQ
ncbi:hypothetical protein [uncultured Dubosiella sp.]|uniref:hypothetical protein n=1 Tax=uncultured Dubosiella sp. TaxID=1937011 RepID=UPI0025B2FE45|nr:hypothetical protein [uncultured Dubosiella sp.]